MMFDMISIWSTFAVLIATITFLIYIEKKAACQFFIWIENLVWFTNEWIYLFIVAPRVFMYSYFSFNLHI